MNRVRTSTRAFSLIEILIAVIILALGLLGLGAVFPVVIREQKLAQDRITGTLAENNIRAILQGVARLRQPRLAYVAAGPTLTDLYSGWAVLQEPWRYYEAVNAYELSYPNAPFEPSVAFGPSGSVTFRFSSQGQWETTWGTNNANAPTANQSFQNSGDIELVSQDIMNSPARREQYPKSESGGFSQFNRAFERCRIPLAARLNPAGDPNDDSPSMVWDMIVRRKLESTDPRALQVAVFIRRVDPRLRPIPRTPAIQGNDSYSVREQFFNNNVAPVARRLPLGEDATYGLPTLDGTDGSGAVRYSGIHDVQAELVLSAGGQPTAADPTLENQTKRHWIHLLGVSGRTDVTANLIGQPGQRAVDNLGNIYSVLKSFYRESDGAWFIKVDPPVPPSVLETAGTGTDFTLPTIRQLAFTPQIPVSVFIVEVQP